MDPWVSLPEAWDSFFRTPSQPTDFPLRSQNTLSIQSFTRAPSLPVYLFISLTSLALRGRESPWLTQHSAQQRVAQQIFVEMRQNKGRSSRKKFPRPKRGLSLKQHWSIWTKLVKILLHQVNTFADLLNFKTWFQPSISKSYTCYINLSKTPSLRLNFLEVSFIILSDIHNKTK